VVWGGEFGRMPVSETFNTGGKPGGRDHNPKGFTYWLAGAGVTKGFGNLSARHGPRLHQAPSDRVGDLRVRKRGSDLNETALWLRTSRQRQITRLLGDRQGVQGIGLGVAQANPRSISKRS
jgi:hypothetical protein